MTDKIPPRPDVFIRHDAPASFVRLFDHEHAVATLAVSALKWSRCLCDEYRRKLGHDCPRCETLRQIEESGWAP